MISLFASFVFCSEHFGVLKPHVAQNALHLFCIIEREEGGRGEREEDVGVSPCSPLQCCASLCVQLGGRHPLLLLLLFLLIHLLRLFFLCRDSLVPRSLGKATHPQLHPTEQHLDAVSRRWRSGQIDRRTRRESGRGNIEGIPSLLASACAPRMMEEARFTGDVGARRSPSSETTAVGGFGSSLSFGVHV